MESILLFLLITIFVDIFFLKKRDRELFARIFSLPASVGLAALALAGLILWMSSDKPADCSASIALVVVPVYLLRREKFMRRNTPGVTKKLRILSSACGVVVAWMYGIIVFGYMVRTVDALFPEVISEMGDLILSAAFSTALIMVLIYRASRHFSDEGFLTNVALRKGNRSVVQVIWIPFGLGIFFAFFSSFLISTRLVQPETPLTDVIGTTRSVDLILIFLFLAICVAPLIEEIIFRGYFFRVFREWIGLRMTIYVIALTFAVLHVGQYWGDWTAIAVVALLGFALTLLRAWTGSTIASAITHYVYNAGVTIIPVVMLAVTNPAYFEYTAFYPSHDAATKEALLKKSIAADPDLVDAYNDLAWLYAQEDKNLPTALELVDKALSYAPERSAYLDTKAVILEKLGRMEESRAIRERLEGELP